MKIPKYWVRGRYPGEDPAGSDAQTAWGWSNQSREEAELMALERARQISKLLSDPNTDRRKLRRGNEYEYAAYPLREQIIETHPGDDGQVGALITRNRYGSLVLNTASVCFVDIDYAAQPVPKVGFLEGIKQLFGGQTSGAVKETPQQLAVKSVQTWAAANPDRSFRLYRTAAGLRLLFTDRLYDPVSPEIQALFNELKSDRLYLALTRKQECFRARLTPKPWRCGVHEARHCYPFDEPNPAARSPSAPGATEAKFKQWLAEYEKAIEGAGVCEWVQTFGTGAPRPEIARVLAIHDRYVLKKPGLPLA